MLANDVNDSGVDLDFKKSFMMILYGLITPVIVSMVVACIVLWTCGPVHSIQSTDLFRMIQCCSQVEAGTTQPLLFGKFQHVENIYTYFMMCLPCYCSG